jgi:hypothetical protein
VRVESAASEVKGKSANHLATEAPFVANVLFFRVWPTLKHFNYVLNIFVLTDSGAEDILQILINFSLPTPKGTVYFYSTAPHAKSI